MNYADASTEFLDRVERLTDITEEQIRRFGTRTVVKYMVLEAIAAIDPNFEAPDSVEFMTIDSAMQGIEP